MPVKVPDWVPGVGGTEVGPPDVAAPTKPPADTSARDAYIAQLAAAHGGMTAKPSAQGAVVKTGANAGSFQPTGFDLYTFTDGTTVEVTPDGQTQNLKLAASSTRATPQATAIGDDKTGWYLPIGPPDANGKPTYQLVVPAGTPNADEEISKAIQRQNDEAERNERTANQAAGRGYMTNAEYAKIANDAATRGQSAADLAEKIRQFDLTQGQAQHQFDVTAAQKDKVDAANILKTAADTGLATANTGLATANTASVSSATDIAKQKAPSEIAEIQARTDLSEAQKAKYIQDLALAKVPTTVQATLGDTSANFAQVDPTTGRVSFTANPNYQPKTQAQIAARVGQLQSLMQAKGQEVQAKVGQTVNGKQYTAEDALRDFNDWHAQNISPQQASLQAAQDDAQFQRAKDDAALRQGAMTSALGAGTQNINAFNANVAANPVGAGYADVMNQVRQGKMPTGQQMKDAFTYQAPNPMQTSQQATMDALKYIDPRVAAANGMPPPNPQGIDIPGMLNRTNYGGPPGAPPAPPATAQVATPPPAQGTTMTPNMVNMSAMPGYGGGGQSTPLPNLALQGAQGAGVGVGGMFSGLPAMPYQAIGANPWDYAPNYMYQ